MLWLSCLFQQMICFGFIPCTKSNYALIYSSMEESHLPQDALSMLQECPQWSATSWSYYVHSGISLWTDVLFVRTSQRNLHISLSLCPNFDGTLLFIRPTSFSILLLHLPPIVPVAPSPLSLQLSPLTSPFCLLIGWAVTVVRMIMFQSGVALWPWSFLTDRDPWGILVLIYQWSLYLHRTFYGTSSLYGRTEKTNIIMFMVQTLCCWFLILRYDDDQLYKMVS